MRDVVVIGGGMCGLGAARVLARGGLSCLVLEKESELGGMAASHRIGACRIEKYYHHLFGTDRVLTGLAGELGLADRIEWKPSSAAFIRGRLRARAASRQGGKELLGYCACGFQGLVDALAADVVSRGGAVRTDTAARSVERGRGCLAVRTAAATIEARRVLSTIPLKALAGIARFDLGERVRSVEYRGVVCMALGLDRCFSDYCWTTVLDERLPFVVAVEHTNWVGTGPYGGDHIIYLARYCDGDSDSFRTPDDRLVEAFLTGLQAMRPDFDRGHVR